MKHALIGMALAAALAITGPATAEMTGSEETYDLLFRDGTLDDISMDSRLVYAREVVNAIKPETATRDTGEISLAFTEGEPPQAELEFRQDEKHRGLGSFPKRVGNPIIMYFVETVVRDMAETAGGSPFYIRNRVKESLIRPAEIEEAEIDIDGVATPAQVITLRPFENDPNGERMAGFDKLALTVTMSEAVPGWYQQLAAEVPGENGPVYRSILKIEEADLE
ncbi:hypothetical protein SAMN05421688_3062 [Poseidonocella pacifica]|uniref:Uncharacterized protein n=1 Tax=Poseidonocella pacifica TaxID=871651 RepID=A0A1I0YGE7_9RHOB|nr:hypothetical protein [Poseidonocella pacifica]SFB12301.1 hypothetical protein SAMN05421688_3062 [Poseidonocella pacifica]